jgi:hypothetical protein
MWMRGRTGVAIVLNLNRNLSKPAGSWARGWLPVVVMLNVVDIPAASEKCRGDVQRAYGVCY